jgi:hypothetical protein
MSNAPALCAVPGVTRDSEALGTNTVPAAYNQQRRNRSREYPAAVSVSARSNHAGRVIDKKSRQFNMLAQILINQASNLLGIGGNIQSYHSRVKEPC